MPEIDQFQLAQDRVREERLRIGLEEETRAHRGLCAEFGKLENENAELVREKELLTAQLQEFQKTTNQLRDMLDENENNLSQTREDLNSLKNVESKSREIQITCDRLRRNNFRLIGVGTLAFGAFVWFFANSQ